MSKTPTQQEALKALILKQPSIVRRILYANFPEQQLDKKSPNGRKTKLPKQAQKLLERTVIEKKLPLSHALNRLGISLHGFYNYIRFAEQGRASQYKNCLQKLQNHYEDQIARQWGKAVESEDIRAIMFTLKVLDRNTFGDTDTKREGEKHLHLHLSPEEAHARLQRQGNYRDSEIPGDYELDASDAGGELIEEAR